MKVRQLIVAISALTLPLLMNSSQAQTSVTQLDATTLRVIERSGKPPHKRQIIREENNPAAFARYSEMVDYNAQPVYVVHSRSGAPGKGISGQRQRISTDPVEIAEFARFEEVSEPAESKRSWRGAPGKNTSRFSH